MGMNMDLVNNYVNYHEPWLRASEIMGGNLFGVKEGIEHFDILPSGKQIDALLEIRTLKGRIISEEKLDECKDTHILAAVFPLSILNIRYKFAPDLFSINQDWYEHKVFAEDAGVVGWQLVRKTPIDGSLLELWDGQQKLLGEDEEIPSAQVVTYTAIGHCMVTRERLLKKTCVRCPDLSSKDRHIIVGPFGIGGLEFDEEWNDSYCPGNLGIISALK